MADGPESGSGLGLNTAQAVGIAIGIVAVVPLLLLFCCYLECGISFSGSRFRGRRRRGDDFENSKSLSHKDPEMQRPNSKVQTHRRERIASGTAPRKPSIVSSAQLYVDGKTELPVPDGLRHEIDGVGRSAATASNRVEIDGTPVEPVELPAGPTATTRQSWRTSATTLFQYTSRPSYILCEDEEGGQNPDAVSPLSPTDYYGWKTGNSSEKTGRLPSPTPAAPGPVASLCDVVEAPPHECDTAKEVLSPQQEEDMLRRDRWSAWRNWGGGAGGNSTS